MLRESVIVLPDIDHSDMCPGFEVQGDLPTAVAGGSGYRRVARASAAFMKYHISQDKVSEDKLRFNLDFTKNLLDPVNAALALEEGAWCEQVAAAVIAGDGFAARVTVTSVYDGNFSAPTAVLGDDGRVAVTVTANNSAEGVWPPGSSLAVAAPVPPVERGTASSLGCRMPSRGHIAELLGETAPEPVDACAEANRRAFAWARDHAPRHVLDRFESSEPCVGCRPGVSANQVAFDADVAIAALEEFQSTALGSTITEAAWSLASPAFVNEKEHSCMLLSPARALDFLMLDAFSASRYPESRPAPPSVVVA